MSVTIYSSTGCIRCAIVKKYMSRHGISYTEFDVKTPNGNEEFKKFYKENRKKVRRDEGGIFFPILNTGKSIVQDAGESLDYFITGSALKNCISANNLGHGRIGSLHISEVPKECFQQFKQILAYLKEGGLNIEPDCTGKNSELLCDIVENKLADVITLKIKADDLKNTDQAYFEELAITTAKLNRFRADIKFNILIDIAGKDGIAPVELFVKCAEIMRKASDNPQLPVFITNSSKDQNINLYAYRQQMRRWINKTEIKK